ncbi:LysE family transporter [Bathymodiolus heckerae thiotrophic gill symbiont]|uniref:LysE family transporter n=1 Tax=Bathymodiolus heckerae thiotrophic gill symbiont TaxID=1052212 RepID=UPI0010FE430A
MFVTLGNPKVILFYLSFLPVFVDLKFLSSLDVAIVALVVSVVLSCCFMLTG